MNNNQQKLNTNRRPRNGRATPRPQSVEEIFSMYATSEAEVSVPANDEASKKNKSKRMVCCVVVDTSLSVTPYIDEIAKGLKIMIRSLQNDITAKLAVELSVLIYNDSLRALFPCQELYKIENTEFALTADGMTYTGTALQKAWNIIRTRDALLRQEALQLYPSLLILVTDGKIQTASADYTKEIDTYNQVLSELDAARAARSLNTLCLRVGKEAINDDSLRRFAEKNSIDLDGSIDYEKYFETLARVILATSQKYGELDLSPLSILK